LSKKEGFEGYPIDAGRVGEKLEVTAAGMVTCEQRGLVWARSVIYIFRAGVDRNFRLHLDERSRKAK